jgi:hypothetical protein
VSYNLAQGIPQDKDFAASSRNAFKGGLRSLLREMSALLREQRDGLKEIIYKIWRIDC